MSRMDSSEVISTMASFDASDWTEEMKESYRSKLSEDSFANRLPVVLYLSSISVLGVVGNIIVLLVYWLKFKPSATRVFVAAIAVCDLVTGVFGLPLQIVTIRFAYDADYWTCRSFFASATLSTQASGFMLIVVAVDRFRRICYPFKKQLNQRNALLITVATIVLSIFVFVPLVPMYGMYSVNTTLPEVQGRMCWTDDNFLGTGYLQAFRIILGFTFFSGLTTMIVAYLLIGLRVCYQTRNKHFLKYGQHNHGYSGSGNEDAQMETRVGKLRRRVNAETSTEVRTDGTPEAEERNRGSNSDSENPEGRDQSDEEESQHVDEEPQETTRHRTSDSPETDPKECSAEVCGRISEDRLDSEKGESSNTFSRGSIMDHPNEGGIKSNAAVSEKALPKATTEAERVHKSEAVAKTPVNGTSDSPETDPKDGSVEVCGRISEDRLDSEKGESSDTFSRGSIMDHPNEGGIKSNAAVSEKALPKATTEAERVHKPEAVAKTPVNGKRMSSRNRRIRSKTTLMMFVVTLCYIVNWLPHYVMRSVRNDPVNWCPDLIDCGWNTYAIVIRSYYINSAVNAFAYVFCNGLFRLKCKQLFCRTTED